MYFTIAIQISPHSSLISHQRSVASHTSIQPLNSANYLLARYGSSLRLLSSSMLVSHSTVPISSHRHQTSPHCGTVQIVSPSTSLLISTPTPWNWNVPSSSRRYFSHSVIDIVWSLSLCHRCTLFRRHIPWHGCWFVCRGCRLGSRYFHSVPIRMGCCVEFASSKFD